MALLLRLLLLAAAPAAAAGCSAAADAPLEQRCGGNGHCDSSGQCACTRPWTGPSCEQLDFLPSPVTSCGPACAYHGGANGTDESWTSWGGQVVRNPKDHQYYMAVSEFANGCTLSTWRCNSQVALARSSTPLGPFKKLGVAVEPWAHNAAIVALPDGGMAIFSLGDGYQCCPASLGPITTNCTAGCSGCPKGPPDLAATASEQTFRLHYAASPEAAAASFPWGYENVTLQGYTWGFPGNWNPAPALLANGSLRVMAHDSWGGMRGTAIFQSSGAANHAGPFELITDDQQASWRGSTHGTEDNFYWQDAQGNHHVLYHWLAGGQESGGHSWSPDGFRWSNVSAAYNGSVPLEGGGHLRCNRQRPKLLLNEARVPTHLYSGCGTSRDGTYTVVAPLNV